MAMQANCLWTAMKAKAFVEEIGTDPVAVDPKTGQPVVKGEDSDKLITKAGFGVVEMAAAAGFVAALLSLVLVKFYVVQLACWVLLGICPVTVYQKMKLRALGGLRGQHNHLRHSVNEFHRQNKKLTGSINKLTAQVESLKAVEDQLGLLATSTGASVERLQTIVRENGHLQLEAKKHLKAQVLQQLMSTVLHSDRDRDFDIEAQEVQVLILRLSNIPGVEFHADRFQAFCESDTGKLTLADVMSIAHNMDEATPEQAIFSYKTSDLV